MNDGRNRNNKNIKQKQLKTSAIRQHWRDWMYPCTHVGLGLPDASHSSNTLSPVLYATSILGWTMITGGTASPAVSMWWVAWMQQHSVLIYINSNKIRLSTRHCRQTTIRPTTSTQSHGWDKLTRHYRRHYLPQVTYSYGRSTTLVDFITYELSRNSNVYANISVLACLCSQKYKSHHKLDLGASSRLQQLITFDHVLFMADGYTVTPYIHSHTWFTSPFPSIFICDQRSLVSIQLSHAAVSIFLQLYLSMFLSPDLLPMAVFLVTLFHCGLAVHAVIVCHYGVVSKLI